LDQAESPMYRREKEFPASNSPQWNEICCNKMELTWLCSVAAGDQRRRKSKELEVLTGVLASLIIPVLSGQKSWVDPYFPGSKGGCQGSKSTRARK
jgi:hypothetical protein